MTTRTIKLVAITILVAFTLPIVLLRNKTESGSGKVLSSGLGVVQNLEANYKTWEADYLSNGGDRNLLVSIGWSKGLSTEHTEAYGQARLNLIDGTASVEIKELASDEDWDVWLVDNRSGPGRTVMPEPGDTMLRLGRLKREGGVAKLEAKLGDETLANNEWELVVVTRAGKNPSENRVMLGMTTLFHRLYHSKQRGQFGVLSDDPAPPASEKRGLWVRLVESFSPTAVAQIGPNPNVTPLEQSITRGRFSFFNETFNGNGRTCGTCHREDNNLTIDPAFIATLPLNDPLFVAETNPALSANFENPALMRQFGLILENVDGFDDLANKFVMRGVPHTLALLQNTLTPATFDGTTQPPNERTGWGGDGAPSPGTLRDFIIGAITQHYPKTLNRTAGMDFRLPTTTELDDLEAFQRSTGRRADLVLTGPGALSLKDEVAAQGQAIFTNRGTPGVPSPGAGRCQNCHSNAGASVNGIQNANFNTGVENFPINPPRPATKRDGGFGTGTCLTGGFGNCTFNTPVLVEAADTVPLFHNNAVSTIEDAVNFYTSSAFQTSPAGIANGGIQLNADEVRAVAAFLREINALENIRSALDLEGRAKNATDFPQVQELLNLAISEIEDAIRVLDDVGLNPSAQGQLRAAIDKASAVKANQQQAVRNSLINQSIAHINNAKAAIVN